MMRYELAKMPVKTNRKQVLLPQIHGSPGFQRSYLAALRRVLKGMAQHTRDFIIPLYKRDLTQDIERGEFDSLTILTNQLTAVAEATLDRLLRREGERHTDQFKENVRRTLGIDLSVVVRQEDLTDYLELAATRNVALIQGLTDDTQKRIKFAVTNNLVQGNSVNVLQADLKKQFGFADSRARLIARDQTSKINSDLNRIRHQQAGIEKYVWKTVRDERVRTLHADLNNTEQTYGEPTGAEQGLPPGQPVSCRCVAAGIVDLEAELAVAEG